MWLARFGIAALVPSVLVGCGAAPGGPEVPEAAPAELAVHLDEGASFTAQITDRSVTGAAVSFARAREGRGEVVRGEAFRQPVFVSVEGDRASGTVGAAPFDVRVTPEGGGFRASGLVRGRPSEFWFGPSELRGTIGRCGYEMRRRGADFVGTAGCGSITQGSIAIPPELEAWTPTSEAVVLGVLLGAGGA